MRKPLMMTPMVLAIGAALALSGCNQAAQHTATTTTEASTVAAPADSGAAGAAEKDAADGLIQPIAFTLSPAKYKACEDFASYVNAQWNQANPIPSDRSRWGGFGMLRQRSMLNQRQILEHVAELANSGQGSALQTKLGRLYAAGMDTGTINKLGYAPIKPQLATIDALQSSSDIAAFLRNSFSNGNAYLFYFYSGADFEDATRQIGYVHQGGLGLPTRAYYLDDKHQDIRAAYVDYIAKSFELTGTATDKADKMAQSVLDFETELAKASLSPTKLRDLDNRYNFVSVAAADKLTPHFSWGKFFQAQGVDIGEGFSLSQPKFMAEFDKLLANAPIDQWQAYLGFHLINDAAPALGKAFQDNRYAFYGKTLRGQPEQKARWKRVIRAVNGAMGMGLGKLYVAEYFPPEAKQRAEALVANVRAALKVHIDDLEWMSDATQKKAIDKLNLFLPKIGYPDADHWRDWSGLTIQPGHYFDNLQAAAKYNYHYNIDKIGTRTDRKEWHMTPQTVNAYYSSSTNTINFPAGILQPPFFYADGDDAVNYGGIGFVIGHEMSHGFDDNGSQFDGHGNRNDWWTAEDRKQFETRAEALVQQYNNYTPIPGKPDLHIKGKLTLGENIADLGGLNVAYTALQMALKANPTEATQKIDGMTQAQRFFLSSARVWEGTIRPKAAMVNLNTDPHSPAKVRAAATARNMPAFAKAFQCQAGDWMVLPADQRVKIW